MSIVDDLIENLVERNAVKLRGSLNIALVDGGLKVSGHVFSTVIDQRKNKTILNVDAPVDADLRVAEIVIPVPQIK
jgi:hypothetical protein